MDVDRFDALSRTLGRAATRRGLFGTLLGVVAMRARATHATGKGHHRRHNSNRRVQAQASCAKPGPGKNLDGCDFSGQDLAGKNLSGSSLRGTLFTGATLRGANLSASNAKGANFHDAKLCGANLSSSTLTNADFTDADLTKADLHASGCRGADFTGATFCQTRACNGKLRNDACQNGIAPCCDCSGTAQCCDDGTCRAGDTWTRCGADGATCAACATGEVCAAGNCEACAGRTGDTACNATFPGPGIINPERQCGLGNGPVVVGCACVERFGGGGSVCVLPAFGCNPQEPCRSDADCEQFSPGTLTICVLRGDCDRVTSCGETVCMEPCPGT